MVVVQLMCMSQIRSAYSLDIWVKRSCSSAVLCFKFQTSALNVVVMFDEKKYLFAILWFL
ncbi:hypothetical protein HanXRQr2_Chr13g0610301 [Helianthus annuus]|uniref:Uncharacterized protein n=1 Tax=Helianthus annuus TaxID=4232 RepID=A0A9K3EK86_HELAN|nr:hypothetical protein HanXRQr2_Chr13g0610301 [Helianthus annuus]